MNQNFQQVPPYYQQPKRKQSKSWIWILVVVVLVFIGVVAGGIAFINSQMEQAETAAEWKAKTEATDYYRKLAEPEYMQVQQLHADITSQIEAMSYGNYADYELKSLQKEADKALKDAEKAYNTLKYNRINVEKAEDSYEEIIEAKATLENM